MTLLAVFGFEALALAFGLGSLAIAFPFLFHLIRRTPKGQTQFSSLMFLKPSPPTLTRRSRLENLLLLFMRALAIALVAFAFTRPFFRGNDSLSNLEVANRRVAVLLDTSASMQRSGLWEQAKQEVESVLDGLEDGDDVSLMTFDRTVNTVVEFDDGREINMDRAGLVRGELNTLEPSWARSDLGKALVSVADRLDVWRDSQRVKNGGASAKLQIVVVSDLQKGSKVEALQAYQWPADVFVKFQSVAAKEDSNATVQLLDKVSEEDEPAFRVRVVNSEGTGNQEFQVNWFDDTQRRNDDKMSFYVSPGTSRVLKLEPGRVVNAQKFVVSGDGEPFDNEFYVVPTEQQALTVAYIGDDDPDDPEHTQFYLQRAMIETAARKITVRWVKPEYRLNDPTVEPPTLVVIAGELKENQKGQVEKYLQGGGSALVVLSDEKIAPTTEGLIAAKLVDASEVKETKTNDRENYSMLAEIDFSSELFKPFANPRFNDFTRVRFWRNRSMIVDESAHVLARFDNDDPAVWRNDLESGGSVFVLASGWHPRDSQLALSTKFVPLINSVIEIAADIPELKKSLVVGDAIVFPAAELASTKRTIVKPDGSREVIEASQTQFKAVEQPGIYQLISNLKEPVESSGESKTDSKNEAGDGQTEKPKRGSLDEAIAATRRGETTADDKNENSERQTTKSKLLFAVNIDRAESNTEVIPVEQLEMFQVKVGEQKRASTDLALMREIRDRDIEDRQKFWKWLIVAAIVLLIGETWLASRTESRAVAGGSGAGEFQPSELSGEAS